MLHCFPKQMHHFPFPSAECEGSCFSTSSAPLSDSLITAVLVDMKRSLMWFWFAFPWWLVMLSIFSCVYWPLTYLPWNTVYSDPLLILKLDALFLITESEGCLCIMDHEPQSAPGLVFAGSYEGLLNWEDREGTTQTSWKPSLISVRSRVACSFNKEICTNLHKLSIF